MRKTALVLSVMGIAALAAATSVDAHPLGGHPALGNAFIEKPSVDPNTFVVAHPAGLALLPGHANHEHPAVAAARATRVIDANTFLVQPPASTQWAVVREAQQVSLAR